MAKTPKKHTSAKTELASKPKGPDAFKNLVVAAGVAGVLFLVFIINKQVDQSSANEVINSYAARGQRLNPQQIKQVEEGTLKGYTWAWSLVINNLETIKKYSHWSDAQKMESKLGFDFKYLNYVKENTPDTAIILAPNMFYLRGKEGKEMPFKKPPGSIFCNRLFANYLVYPRRMVFYDDKDVNPFYKQVTHLAMVKGWGVDMLQYPIGQTPEYAVLPIQKPLTENNQIPESAKQ